MKKIIPPLAIFGPLLILTAVNNSSLHLNNFDHALAVVGSLCVGIVLLVLVREVSLLRDEIKGLKK